LKQKIKDGLMVLLPVLCMITILVGIGTSIIMALDTDREVRRLHRIRLDSAVVHIAGDKELTELYLKATEDDWLSTREHNTLISIKNESK
jgi:hypothetical protein